MPPSTPSSPSSFSPALPLSAAFVSSVSSASSPLSSPASWPVDPCTPRHLHRHPLPGGSSVTQIRLSNDTPLRLSASSLPSPPRTHASIDPLLCAELLGSVRYEVPPSQFLDCLLLPSDPARRSEVEAQIDATIAAIDATIAAIAADHQLREKDAWRGCSDYAEAVFLPAFAALCHSIVDLAVATTKVWPARANCTKRLQGSTSRRKVDFYMVPAAKLQDPLQWRHLLLFGEMKNRKREIPFERLECQIAGYAREIFYSQPPRRFVHALYVSKAQIMLYRFDRCGALASQSFNMHQEWKTFVRVILAYAWMDDVDMGFDPAFTTTAADPSTSLDAGPLSTLRDHPPDMPDDMMPLASPPGAGSYSLRVGDDDYVLGTVLASRKVLAGRATICWEATRTASGEPTSNFVIKDSWRQTTQEPEERMYDRARRCGVDGLLDLHTAATVHTSGMEDTVLQNVRRGCTGQVGRPRKKRKREEKAQSSTRHVRGRKSPAVVPETDGEQEAPVDPGMDRVRVRLVFRNAVGIPLHRVASAQAFFEVIRDALQCHRDLYIKAKILHRDISVHNILATTPEMILTGGVPRRGVLVDFDYAISTTQPTTGARHRTGTLPFLAVSVLKGYPNSYRADLESFFYVLCYGCCTVTGTGEPAAGKPLAQWHVGNPSTIASVKTTTLMTRVAFRKGVLNHFTPLFAQPARDLMDRLRQLLVRSAWFSLFTLEDHLEERREQAETDLRNWDGTGDSPFETLRRQLIEEEDADAHVLYAGMMDAINTALDAGTL